MSLQRLEFDSELSGHEIGKCTVEKIGDRINGNLTAEFKKYDMIYLFAKFTDDITVFLNNCDWVLADVRITLSQDIRQLKFDYKPLSQEDFSIPTDTDRLEQLGVDLYKESRFYFDKHTRSLGKKIYKEWIKNSISKKAADEIIILRDKKDDLIGFVTVKVNDDLIEPVLVKIDRNFVGKGYGKSLMNKFFSFVVDRKPIINVNVHTQLRNTTAIRFYQSFGLKVWDHDLIYHVYPHGVMGL